MYVCVCVCVCARARVLQRWFVFTCTLNRKSVDVSDGGGLQVGAGVILVISGGTSGSNNLSTSSNSVAADSAAVSILVTYRDHVNVYCLYAGVLAEQGAFTSRDGTARSRQDRIPTPGLLRAPGKCRSTLYART